MPSATHFFLRPWRHLRDAVLSYRGDPELDSAVYRNAADEAPVLWLLGKVQAGKTSIIHALTGAAEAEIGAGFQACTRHSRIYDFPPDAPVVRFLDTPGLGEVGVDPQAELELLERRSHVIVAVARAMDPAQDAVLDVLRQVRSRDPHRPVLLAQTRLHDGYPDGADHPDATTLATAPEYEDLRRALAAQASRFRTLPGDGLLRTVAVDLTRPEDGFSDPDHGLEDLIDALDEASAAGHGTLLRELARRGHDSRLDAARPQLLGHAVAAGVCDLVPVTGLVTVPAVQARMLHGLARHYDRTWDRKTLVAFLASLGSGTALGIGAAFTVRQLGKLVPVWGQTAGAAAASVASAAVTYALGRAACEYLEQAREGRSDPDAVAATFRGSLKSAHNLFRTHGPMATSNTR